ncbi:MAG: hypothetical protein M0Q14_11250, partial [Tissierellaceae bacterium]|nr:hypothetical protein [Tissierellaceae bacterium]
IFPSVKIPHYRIDLIIKNLTAFEGFAMLSSEIKKSIGISGFLAKRSIDFQFFNEREKASKPETKGRF